jgi:hypothetical protein
MKILFNNEDITRFVDRLDSKSIIKSIGTTDRIYIGADFPFNHFYLKMGLNTNVISATMKVEYYGNGWNEVVEMVDETNALSNSGFVKFTPNKNSAWNLVSDSQEIGITNISYNKYWTRITFNEELTSDIDISYIGNKFSDDEDLFSEFPVFNDSNFMKAFQLGKADWEEQTIRASDIIIEELIKKRVIVSSNQILDISRFRSASISKTAEIIFSSFGNDYIEQKDAARKEYLSRLDMSSFSVDSNNNAILEPVEVVSRVGWLSR